MKKSTKPAPPSYTKVFGKTIVKLGEEDPRVTAITAAMPEGTGTDLFRDRFPNRFYDVGLAEQHSVTFAAGLAAEGYRPIVAVYSTFLQRGYDQIEHDVCLQKLPVIFALDRGGLVGHDGPTHHGTFDFAFLRQIPHMTVMAPADENELQHMLKTAVAMNAPVAIRYPRGVGEGVKMDDNLETYPIGKGVRLREGSDVTILAVGNRVYPSLDAAKMLEAHGISAGVVNMRFVKPIDRSLLSQAIEKTPKIITVEDHVLDGGFGSAILEAVSDAKLQADVLRLGINDRFVMHGTQPELYKELGLDAAGIARRAAEFLGKTVKFEDKVSA